MIALASIDPNWAIPIGMACLFVAAFCLAQTVSDYLFDREFRRRRQELRRVEMLAAAYRLLERHRAQQVTP